MKSPRTLYRTPGRIIVFATIGAVLLILIGTGIALNQAGFTLAAFAGYVSETVSRLAGANLIVKVDRTTLPADGKATTTIYVTANHEFPITAKVTSGGGEVVAAANSSTDFVYTTSTTVGTVVINITSGSLSEDLELTLVDPIVPANPTIIAPNDGSTTNNPKPEIVGTGPINTKILITTNGSLNTTLQTDDKGNFRGSLDKPLYSGKHTLSTVAQTELGVISQVSNLVTITVETDPVKLDTTHIRTTPTKILASDSFGLFVPVSLNTSRVVAELQGQSFELQNLHKTSIFTGTLPAPDQSGLYTGNLILYDLANSGTRFDRSFTIVVISS
ncbi:MAG: hypothetical protein WC553_02090 [Patescibacteria group bacterium]|jgi:hypothetical protein